MIRRPPRSTQGVSSAASDVYKRQIWHGMKARCYNSNHKSYDYYGGRGIKVCDSWKNSFENFRDWSLNNGYQKELSIERKDVNGNYEPENCK